MSLFTVTDLRFNKIKLEMLRSNETKKLNTVGSRFATVRFTTNHFYDPCRDGSSTPDLWCIPVATLGVLSLLRALLALFRGECISYFSVLVQFF